MVCSCCGTKKGFLEMFFSVEGSKEVKLCSDCKEIVENWTEMYSAGKRSCMIST